MITQVSSFHEVHDDVKVLLVLEGVEHVDYKPMSESSQELSFIENGINASLGDDST